MDVDATISSVPMEMNIHIDIGIIMMHDHGSIDVRRGFGLGRGGGVYRL